MMGEFYYNAVLLPPAGLATELTNFAYNAFHHVADDYCLAPGGPLPHVTLCQTPLMTEDDAASLRQDLRAIFGGATLALSCPSYYARHALRAKDRQPVIGVGLNVELQNASLKALHQTVAAEFQRRDLVPRNPTGPDYWPHVTFAKFLAEATLPPMTFPEVFWREQDGWRPVFGRSDGVGQLLEILP